MNTKYFIFIILIVYALLTSCSSSKAVISNNIDITKYKYVVFGAETSGDGDFDDVIMMVQNGITETKLNVISSSNISTWDNNILSPSIRVLTEHSGHTYITVTFYDYLTHQIVAVIKSDGIGLTTVSHDQEIAVNAIKKKLIEIFGSKEELQ